MVWRNRKKIRKIINDYLYIPFFLLIILCSHLFAIPTVEINVIGKEIRAKKDQSVFIGTIAAMNRISGQTELFAVFLYKFYYCMFFQFQKEISTRVYMYILIYTYIL